MSGYIAKWERLCGIYDPERLNKEYRHWVGVAFTGGCIEGESSWAESVAVGHRKFIEEVKLRN